MATRASKLFLPTLRDAPGDAEAASHKLLVRGGYIRQLGAGIWTFLPLGWRVHQKIVGILREEMDATGAQEMSCPLLTPAELWEKSGRIRYPEVFKLRDRNDRPFVLPMTHEETFAFHAAELQSYRQLPQVWYHFSTKARDEPRSRGGLIRLREFIMKDAYSFDRDEAGLDESFARQAVVYRRILDRCGLRYYEVEAEPGMMGGSESKDFLAPAGSGENELALCENGDYGADTEVAKAVPSAPDFPERLDTIEEVETPGVATIDDLARFLGIDPRATSKAMPVVKSDGTLVLGLVRGDDRLHDVKLAAALQSDFRPAEDEEIRRAFGAGGGSLGPVGVAVEVIADEALREGQFVAGANRDGWHLRGVDAGRDFEARFADIRCVREGDRCPRCGGALQLQRAIEVGHIFKLGTRFSEALGATYLDEQSVERPIVMGSYGIGPARTMAAVVEQNHDDASITWPKSLSPYDVEIVALQATGEGVLEQAERLADDLEEAGLSVLLDDRDLRAGEKFADADLFGIPLRLTVGRKTLEDGAVDFRRRALGVDERVSLLDVRTRVREAL
ncbi:MAG: proline--tRNA ligase [Actinobacteria bacterium]|nr:proline--tRNA ligase [Actinomycetota bacterium]